MEEELIFSLPGGMQLIFAILVWTVFFLIYRSSPDKRMNQWCLVGGLIFGIGVMKEYLYYDLGLWLIAKEYWTKHFSQNLYSLLSAVFYYLAAPAMLMFFLYFCRMEKKNRMAFRVVRFFVFVPAVVLTVMYPPLQVLALQQDSVFCLTVAFYDWLYGMIGAVLMLYTFWQERLTENFGRRLIAGVGILIPLFCWLIAAFPRHALGKGNASSKLWQGNVIVVAGMLLYFIFWMFHGGLWGMRLEGKHYDWEDSSALIRENAGYVAHALKNELAKIEWSLSLLKEEGVEAEELAVIGRSADYLRDFIRKTQMHSGKIHLDPQECRARELFRAALPVLEEREGIQVSIGVCDEAPLYCDRLHVTEVLRNLLLNAAEAAGNNGHIELSCRRFSGILGSRVCIGVKDDGPGIPKEEIQKIFNPYYTTWGSQKNMGLGLYYCRNVMQAHAGRIEAESREGEGSTFLLWFPGIKRKQKTESRK